MRVPIGKIPRKLLFRKVFNRKLETKRICLPQPDLTDKSGTRETEMILLYFILLSIISQRTCMGLALTMENIIVGPHWSKTGQQMAFLDILRNISIQISESL